MWHFRPHSCPTPSSEASEWWWHPPLASWALNLKLTSPRSSRLVTLTWNWSCRPHLQRVPIPKILSSSPQFIQQIKLQTFKCFCNLQLWRKTGSSTIGQIVCILVLVSWTPSQSELQRWPKQMMRKLHVDEHERPGKLVGKHRFWSYTVSKLEEVSHEMFVLMLPRVSSRVSGSPVAPPYGGSCKTSPCRTFPSRLSCHFAWQAQHFVTFQPVW